MDNSNSSLAKKSCASKQGLPPILWTIHCVWNVRPSYC